MASSKKQRGKQRRAAKSQQAAATRNNNPPRFIPATDINNPQMYGPGSVLTISEIIGRVQRGDDVMTRSMENIITHRPPDFDISGFLSVVLRFLRRCEHETFDNVIGSVGGDLATPVTWIKVLLTATMSEQSSWLLIIESIGPLVKCMCDDTNRLFFKSNKYWDEAISPFVEMIHTMILVQMISGMMPITAQNKSRNKPDESVLRALIQHEGLLRSVNQTMGALAATEASHVVLHMVQKGDNISTKRLLSPDMSVFLSGILSAVLGFLKRCEHESFDEVIASVRGDIATPATWIYILSKAMDLLNESGRSCRLKIAEHIGPLVKCMCADTERLFFNSNKLWGDAILPFVQLISVLIIKCTSSECKEKNVVDTLLQYDALLNSVIQWGFWGDKYRPDIVKELSPSTVVKKLSAGVCKMIVCLGRKSTKCLLSHAANARMENNRSILESIGTTPIVSKNYDPGCLVSCTSGLLRLMKTKGCQKNDFTAVQSLIRGGDCVDKGVITEIIDLGMNYTKEDRATAEFVSGIIASMVRKVTNRKNRLISDTRVAFAIRAGLIELCLGFIERFEDVHNILANIRSVFISVYEVALHEKTAKAITCQRNKIEEKIALFEQNNNVTNNAKCNELVAIDWGKQLYQNRPVTNNAKCKALVAIVQSILNLNGANCCRCNKSLSRKERKQCDGCNRMTYCSRACQKEDWMKGGHKLSCCKLCTIEQAGQFQGSGPTAMPQSGRAAAKLKEQEINITMIQRKLFFDSSQTILSQASMLNLPLHDCVVVFDLRYPLSANVRKYTEIFNTPEWKKAFEDSRLKENITCIYSSDIHNGGLDEDGNIPFIAMHRLYPHEWLTNFIGVGTSSGRWASIAKPSALPLVTVTIPSAIDVYTSLPPVLVHTQYPQPNQSDDEGILSSGYAVLKHNRSEVEKCMGDLVFAIVTATEMKENYEAATTI